MLLHLRLHAHAARPDARPPCRARLVVAPNGVAYAPAAARPGVVPRLLREILATRVMIKAAMKRAGASAKARGPRTADARAARRRRRCAALRAPRTGRPAGQGRAAVGAPPAATSPSGALQRLDSGPHSAPGALTCGGAAQVLQRVLNARQFGLKLIANVTYGYTAAGFSGRMPLAELADSIVQARIRAPPRCPAPADGRAPARGASATAPRACMLVRAGGPRVPMRLSPWICREAGILCTRNHHKP